MAGQQLFFAFKRLKEQKETALRARGGISRWSLGAVMLKDYSARIEVALPSSYPCSAASSAVI